MYLSYIITTVYLNVQNRPTYVFYLKYTYNEGILNTLLFLKYFCTSLKFVNLQSF